MSKIKAIIPCAGYGTRMNMANYEAKELLIDPCIGKPIINWTLDLCTKYNLEPVIISRAEKKEFNKYVESKGANLKIIEPQGEWSDTILEARPEWGDENVLLLPDFRFKFTDTLHELLSKLRSGNQSVYGIHEVRNVSKWGHITEDYLEEKPVFPGPGMAWGVIGFTAAYGGQIFNACREKTKLYHLQGRTGFVRLDKGMDITRTGKVLNYEAIWKVKDRFK